MPLSRVSKKVVSLHRLIILKIRKDEDRKHRCTGSTNGKRRRERRNVRRRRKAIIRELAKRRKQPERYAQYGLKFVENY
jgi:hypothetical protein